jgi:hypothetical protein
MVRLKFLPLVASALIGSVTYAQGGVVTQTSDAATPALVTLAAPAAESWPVETSLKTTLRIWTQRRGWPAPQFLTEADWPVDVPGSIAGSIEDALKTLAEGFGKSPTRPRIELSANHIILVSEAGAE